MHRDLSHGSPHKVPKYHCNRSKFRYSVYIQKCAELQRVTVQIFGKKFRFFQKFDVFSLKLDFFWDGRTWHLYIQSPLYR